MFCLLISSSVVAGAEELVYSTTMSTDCPATRSTIAVSSAVPCLEKIDDQDSSKHRSERLTVPVKEVAHSLLGPVVDGHFAVDP